MIPRVVVEFRDLLHQLPGSEGLLPALVDLDGLETIEDKLVLIFWFVIFNGLVIVHHELPGYDVPVDWAPVMTENLHVVKSLAHNVEIVWKCLWS